MKRKTKITDPAQGTYYTSTILIYVYYTSMYVLMYI